MWTKNEVKHPLWRACRKTGLRQIGRHVRRHTFAWHLVMRGAAIKVVQELLVPRQDFEWTLGLEQSQASVGESITAPGTETSHPS
jgi:hypothetical protein